MILQCVLVGQKIFPTRDDAKLGRERSIWNSPTATPRTHSNATLFYTKRSDFMEYNFVQNTLNVLFFLFGIVANLGKN